jgi:hypothetical protein
MARADDVARYREAAHTTLNQLDWCVEYLRRIRKGKVSQQLAINTANIRKRIEEPERGAVTRRGAG